MRRLSQAPRFRSRHPLRRPGRGVRPAPRRRSVLQLPRRRGCPCGGRAMRDDGRLRAPGGDHRDLPGARSDQAPRRNRRDPGRAPHALRCARQPLARGAARARSALPRVRRGARGGRGAVRDMTRSTTMRPIAAIVIAAALALPAGAETLYKLIDKNGKVTYSEEKPKSFDGQVIRIDIDTNANTATLPKPPPAPPAGGANRAESEDPQGKRDKQEDRVRIAGEKVEAARNALEDAQNHPGAGEIT